MDPTDPLRTAVDRLATARGIGRAWYDYRGQRREFSHETRLALLRAMGIDGDDGHAVERALEEHEAASWRRPLRPVYVVDASGPISVYVTVPDDPGCTGLKWNLTLADGRRRHGSREIARLEQIGTGQVDGERYARIKLELPGSLPPGHHRLSVRIADRPVARCALIAAPPHCHGPGPDSGLRHWGLTVQLYTLRSQQNWGIGDFADLADLVELVAPLGCAVIGLNPLHAMMPANPAHCSPYSPSSRQFLNVLYVSVPRVEDYAECPDVQARVESAEFQSLLAELRATERVDYPQVAAAKLEMLRLLYASFESRHVAAASERGQEFLAWVEARGEPLRRHALYDALDAHFRAQSADYWGWPVWPEAYRDPGSSAVRAFASEQASEVRFYLYLQWLAETQLAAVQQAALAAGMAIGLYGDVAVGVNPAGSETWSDQALYLKEVSIGAPPDPLGPKGQDWGIPPQDPHQLIEQAYAPFITMVRNNMRCVGALRLDHVMALFRQWWVPRGLGATGGAYVHYPLDDLMGVLALESVRNECLVIGEDLGTVPDEMREAMHRWRLNHYKVLIFEKTLDGRYRRPDEYVENALATVTTHDLPTLRGWWEGRDITLRTELDLYPDDDARQHAINERLTDRHAMMQALVAAGLWYWHPQEPVPDYSHALSRAIHLFLGKSHSLLAVLQLEDLSGMTDPVNVPGTSTEHANWQRKMNLPADEILGRDDVRELLQAMGKARRGEEPNA
ncbi:MAG TPA: 4-alpha-glucanotransferase [Steroidobacteraceae bacterium]|nr:4-alpha-glucanotransferase [Steroidobacteraceae bacterium]